MNKRTKLQSLKLSYRRKWKYVLAIMPSILLLYLFNVYPNVAVFPFSFYKWNPLNAIKTFVGWHNYEIMFTVQLEKTLDRAMNTLMYVLGLLIIQTVFSLIISMVLQKPTKRNKFFRAYFMLPMVFSTTMISMTWNYMYDANLGVINNILGMLGVEGYPGVNFMDEGWKAILLIVIVHIWANLGYPILMLTSGLNTISADVGEAARMDGANSWQTFRHITLPLLLPTLFRLSLTTLTTGAMATDYIYMMGNRHCWTWASDMYTATLTGTDYGGVSAASVILFVVLAVLSTIQFIAMKKVEDKILG